jgi:hypothetical protein
MKKYKKWSLSCLEKAKTLCSPEAGTTASRLSSDMPVKSLLLAGPQDSTDLP